MFLRIKKKKYFSKEIKIDEVIFYGFKTLNPNKIYKKLKIKSPKKINMMGSFVAYGLFVAGLNSVGMKPMTKRMTEHG